MLKKLLPLLLAALLLPLMALADSLSFTAAPETLRPGKTERISFSAPQSGKASIYLMTQSGKKAALVREGMNALEGVNHLTWDGLDLSGEPVAAGTYLLTLQLNGETCQQGIQIGEESPQILSVQADIDYDLPWGWRFTVNVNMAGTLTLRADLGNGQWATGLETKVSAGENAFSWDGMADGQLPQIGEFPVQLTLTDRSGFAGTTQQIFLLQSGNGENEGAPAPTPAPAAQSADIQSAESPAAMQTAAPAANHEVIPSAVTTRADEFNYWTLPMGMDAATEAEIWEVLMQPMTVIDGNQREVYRLRKTPDKSTKRDNVVGEITYASQGVHVLETLDNGWTLVEAYNSSYGPDCTSRPGYGVTDDRIQGYVQTSLLKTIQPKTDYGLVIDKLEQKMYIFSEGKCIGELLVSTGLNNAKQSWNETPSGEFVMISRMGGFPAGNLWCDYGMRVNGGCAIHEVPYIGNADTPASQRDYSSQVKLLGSKASHGCIRVQKAANEQGQNIKWLWNNIKVNTKVIIWDDTGRLIHYPSDDTKIYYNPNNGKNYHEDQYCDKVKDRYLPLTEITYGELNTTYSYLTPCSGCAQIKTKAEIDALNAANGF